MNNLWAPLFAFALVVFNNNNLNGLRGNVGIGHVRYSTTGKSLIENSQPFVSEFESGTIAIAHNGDIINSMELRREPENYLAYQHGTAGARSGQYETRQIYSLSHKQHLHLYAFGPGGRLYVANSMGPQAGRAIDKAYIGLG